MGVHEEASKNLATSHSSNHESTKPPTGTRVSRASSKAGPKPAHSRSMGNGHSHLEDILKEGVEEAAKLRGELQAAQEANHQLRVAEQAAREEVNVLKAQAIHLKQDISAATAATAFLTDEDLVSKWNDVFHEIRTWAVTSIKTIDLDAVRLASSPVQWMKELMPLYKSTRYYPAGARTYAVNILICIVSAYTTSTATEGKFLEIGFDTPGGIVLTGAMRLAGRSSASGNVPPPLTFPDTADFASWKRWLRTTHDLVKSVDPKALVAVKDNIIACGINYTSQAWSKLFGTSLNETILKHLGKVLEKVADILMEATFHPADYRLDMPKAFAVRQNVFFHFNAEEFDDMDGSEAMEGRQILLAGVIFPMLIKVKNEKGEKISPVIVAKAKAITWAPPPKE